MVEQRSPKPSMWVRILLSLPLHGVRGEAVNTSDCGSDTRGFESHRTPHFKIGDLA